MDPLIVGLIGIAILLVFLFSGLSIGAAMALVGFVGFAVLVGFGPALGLLKSVPYSTFAHYDLSVIPLFILMGSFAFAAGMMKSEGALSVRVVATHPVLSGPAYERIEQSPIDELIVTDTIPLKGKSDKIKVISVAEHFADVIDKVYNYKSISDTYIR